MANLLELARRDMMLATAVMSGLFKSGYIRLVSVASQRQAKPRPPDKPLGP